MDDWLDRTLLALTGTADIRLAAERLADQELATLGEFGSIFEVAPRYNLLPLIRELASGPSGTVGVSGDSYIISLNSNDNEARRRFTLAHEIGHILISKASGRNLYETADYKTERLLDEFASRLILPTAKISEWCKSVAFDVSIKTLEAATKKLLVSMIVLVKRLGQTDLLNEAQRGILIGAVSRSRKAKSDPALRVYRVATPSWGFIPINKRFSSIGLQGSAQLFEETERRRSTTGIINASAKLLVKEASSHKWSILETFIEQKIYRVRATGGKFMLVLFDWPRGQSANPYA